MRNALRNTRTALHLIGHAEDLLPHGSEHVTPERCVRESDDRLHAWSTTVSALVR